VLDCVAVCDAVCCSVMQCVAVWCSVLQCGAVCCSVGSFNSTACVTALKTEHMGPMKQAIPGPREKRYDSAATQCNALQRTATHYSVLQHTATRCNTL